MQRLVVQDLTQLGILFAGIAAIAALSHVVERATGRVISHHLGWNGVLLTGWLGVPLHELSHVATAKLFGHRIVGVALFDPDPATGTLGYVRHAYSQRTPLQLVGNFIIGVAPLIFGALALAALTSWMIGPKTLMALLDVPSRTLHDFGDLRLVGRDAFNVALRIGQVIWRERTWWLPLQLYLCICVASHWSPSGADLAGAWQGALLLAGVLVAVTFAAAFMQVQVRAPTVPLVLMAAITVLAAAFQALWAALARLIDSLVLPPRQPIKTIVARY